MATRTTRQPAGRTPPTRAGSVVTSPADDPANADAGAQTELPPDDNPADSDAGESRGEQTLTDDGSGSGEPLPPFDGAQERESPGVEPPLVDVDAPQRGQYVGHLLPHSGYTSIALGARSYRVDPATDCIVSAL